jgi:hypothetical protein
MCQALSAGAEPKSKVAYILDFPGSDATESMVTPWEVERTWLHRLLGSVDFGGSSA